jgi:hypothetical protein
VSEWGGQPLGTSDYDRPIRDGTVPSAHSYGAATDWRYEPNWLPGTNPTPVPRKVIVDELIPWLINNSLELRIDSIHDYVGDRIWHAGRTMYLDDAHTRWWKDQNGAGAGMGESWARYLHIETTLPGFKDTTVILERPGIADPHPPPPPKPPTGDTVNWNPTATTVTGVKDAPPVNTTVANQNNDWAMIAFLKAIQKMAGLPITGKYDQATANVVDSKL